MTITKIISMSIKELDRITIMEKLKVKTIKQSHAAKQLGISIRQVQRLSGQFNQFGSAGLVHKSRGKASNRALPQSEKSRIADIIKDKYPDFGPTFAAEKLLELHDIHYCDETIRRIMITAGLWRSKKHKKENIHLYRDRRSCLGELIQLDGSDHDWFEGRADKCCLLAFIDDATSQIMDGVFVEYEGTFPLFEATEHYLKKYGLPLSLYVDRHSTYKINRQATTEESLRDAVAKTQYGRAMEQLRIGLIFALSSEAKGRVERLFETLQDRLVKELRLAGISDKTEATRFFREVYIPKHNAKFAVAAKDPANVHNMLLPTDDLKKIFTVQTNRAVSKDLVIQYKNARYYLTVKGGYRYILVNAVVTVTEDREGNITVFYKDKPLPYQLLPQPVKPQPAINQVVGSKDFQTRRVYIPSANHPWKKGFKLI